MLFTWKINYLPCGKYEDRLRSNVVNVLAKLPAIQINLHSEVGRLGAWCDRKADGNVNVFGHMRVEGGSIEVYACTLDTRQRITVRPFIVREIRQVCTDTLGPKPTLVEITPDAVRGVCGPTLQAEKY